MSSPAAKQAMTDFLLRLPESTRQNMQLVTPKSLGQDLLYHLSYDNALQCFTPFVTKRSAEGEDRSIPRISTAPSLLTCLLGYQTELQDFHNRPNVTSADGRKVEYQGGWVIYGLSFEYAIRPNDKLVPDAGKTDEHWLVTYDRCTAEYIPTRLGKVFYDQVTYKASSGEFPDVHIEMVIEVNLGVSLNLGRDVKLPSGYWVVEVRNLHTSKTFDTIDIRRVREITKSDYEGRKTLAAGHLGMDIELPASSHW